jgi:multicomponent Na+:H+ antiporter subunit E
MQILRRILLTLLFWGLWVVFTLDLGVLSLCLGLFFAIMVSIGLGWMYAPSKAGRGVYFMRLDLVVLYFLWLLVQSWVASIQLLCKMLRNKYSPGVLRIRTRLKSEVGRLLLANSITLIPGTMTLWMEGRLLYVHCFDMESSHSIEAGRAIKRPVEDMLERLFG